jgi:serine/threonine protein kinase
MENILEKMDAQKKHFSEDKIFDCIYYLIDALNFLHDKGISHKDLRPKYKSQNSLFLDLRKANVFIFFLQEHISEK